MCLRKPLAYRPAAVLEKEIRDILVRIRIWLMDPAPDPGPTLDPTPFFSDFKNAKKNSYFSL